MDGSILQGKIVVVFIIFIKIFKLSLKEGYVACKGVLVEFKAYQGAVSFYGPWKGALSLRYSSWVSKTRGCSIMSA